VTIRLYVDATLSAGLGFELPAGQARHVQVRRAQPGEVLQLFNGLGGQWTAEVLAMGRQQVSVRLLDFDPQDRESRCAITIALGMPANERMDGLVEKATELGVATIQPLVTERSVLRLAGERAERKREHWQAVAVAAAEQCGRTRVPQVAPVLALDRWLATAPTASVRLLLSPGAALRPALAEAVSMLVLSGPEGGLSPAEHDAARACGFVATSLGPRVLRADTAPLALLAWAMLQD
jgi:16S rRNA (uracil1498-N3)-methyltransferase